MAALECSLKPLFIGRSDSLADNRGVHAAHALILSLVTFVLLTLSGPAAADSDQDRARAAAQAGQVLPLKTLLMRLEADHPGQVLEVELEQHDGRWIYEIKVLQPDGRLIKLEVDAATAEVLRRKERPYKSNAAP